MSSANSSGGSDLSDALAAGAVALLPPQVQDLLKPGKTPDRIQHAITWAARRDPAVLHEHVARRHRVKQFEDIRDLPLNQLDAVARHFARKFRRRALLTGAITGLPGGLWALVAAGADVQLTAVYAVRMAADIAQSYGYDTGLIDEQAHLAEVLALAAGIDSLRGVGNWLTREGLVHMLPEILPRVLMKLSVEVTEEQAAKLVGRLIPGIGAAVGGAIDYTFLRVAGERAIAYYRNRYMIDHGLALLDNSVAAPINPAFAPAGTPPAIAAPPAPQVAVVAASPASSASSAPSAAPVPAKAPAPAQKPVPQKHRRSSPERFGIYLAIFAVFALGITILACAALSILAYSGIQHLFH